MLLFTSGSQLGRQLLSGPGIERQGRYKSEGAVAALHVIHFTLSVKYVCEEIKFVKRI